MAIREILKTQYSFRFVLFLTINCDLHILLKFKEKKRKKEKRKKKFGWLDLALCGPTR